MGTSNTATPGLVKLDVKVWRDKVIALATAQITKREADAASRAADTTIKAVQAELLLAMNGAPAALCGHAVLTPKTTSDAKATLTLSDGSKLDWTAITSLLAGNRTIPAKDVLSLYGGRSGSTSIAVAGTP